MKSVAEKSAGSDRYFFENCSLVNGRKIKPVIEGVYPLADAGDVLQRVLSRGAAGKIILRP